MKRNKESLLNLIERIYGEVPNGEFTINELRGFAEDNEEFFREFKKYYSVNMDDFRYYDYFYEDQFIILNLIRRVLIKLGVIKDKKIKITLSHLENVIQKGRWFVPS